MNTQSPPPSDNGRQHGGPPLRFALATDLAALAAVAGLALLVNIIEHKQEARKLVEHPVACIDCHQSHTMQLRITRPAFTEGIRALKAAQGVSDYGVNRMATRQEMRSYVRARCHVEYYFRGDQKRLIFPWAKGIKVEAILAYYDEAGFRDWVHADIGAPPLKAQHPEFEMWSQGIHARSGVACADCHMPCQRVGAYKVSNHRVHSPLPNIQKACQTCHHWPQQELLDRVQIIQDRPHRMRDRALDALVDLIGDLKEAAAAGRSEAELAVARRCQRQAQFYVDYVEAENSTGFHAPQEAVRILGEAIDLVRQGQNALHAKAAPGHSAAVRPPTAAPAC